MAILELCLTSVLAVLSVHGQMTADFQGKLGAEFSKFEQLDDSYVIAPAQVSLSLGVLYFGSQTATKYEMWRLLDIAQDDNMNTDLYARTNDDVNRKDNSESQILFKYNDGFLLNETYKETASKVFDDISFVLDVTEHDAPVISSYNTFHASFDNKVTIAKDDYLSIENEKVHANLGATLKHGSWQKTADVLVFSLEKGAFNFVAIAPKEPASAEDLSQCFHFLNYGATLNQTQSTLFKSLLFPPGSIFNSFDLGDNLQELGADLTFSPEADFGGIGNIASFGGKVINVNLKYVRQSVRFSVNEKGPSAHVSTDFFTSPVNKKEANDDNTDSANNVGQGLQEDNRQVEVGNAPAKEEGVDYVLSGSFVFAVVTAEYNNIISAGHFPNGIRQN